MSAGRGFAQLSQLLLHFTSDVSLKYSKINFLLHILDIRIGYHMRDEVISFIARGSDFVTGERSERGTKYDIITSAIKLILPSLECDNLFITYLCLYLGQKSDYIFTSFIYTLSTFRNECKIIV